MPSKAMLSTAAADLTGSLGTESGLDAITVQIVTDMLNHHELA